MFLKRLTISNNTGIIRDITFQAGMNLIIDNTTLSDTQATGNAVGKTTTLKLIDFCLGGKPDKIYKDDEHRKDTNTEVYNFLVDTNVVVRLTLGELLDESLPNDVVIERNFLKGKKNVIKLNDKQYTSKDFSSALMSMLFPNVNVEKPTFRQVISHNIRIDNDRIDNTLNRLHTTTKLTEYETLHLFLLGVTGDNYAMKQDLKDKISIETILIKRLELNQTKNKYKIALDSTNAKILELEKQKATLNLNEDFERELEQLSSIRYQISIQSGTISKLEIRKKIIEAAISDLKSKDFKVDMEQLQRLYSVAKKNIDGIQKTFEELVTYHNAMVYEKEKFISSDLPNINSNLSECRKTLNDLRKDEEKLGSQLVKGISFMELEELVNKLTKLHQTKGEYAAIISEIVTAENKIKSYKEQLAHIDNELYSDEQVKRIDSQISKFNEYFSEVSKVLYDEEYALSYETRKDNKTDSMVYTFSTFNVKNMSSGKKQGEILCYDIGYTMFADSESIPCLHFLLNDKKELVSINQLTEVSKYLKGKNIQLVMSILKDKLNDEILSNSYTAIELSQEDKLFKF